jgi:hypothetical protein
MSNLPKYYFQDIPAEVMDEIMKEMHTADPEPEWEEIDHWLNCHNSPPPSRPGTSVSRNSSSKAAS